MWRTPIIPNSIGDMDWFMHCAPNKNVSPSSCHVIFSYLLNWVE